MKNKKDKIQKILSSTYQRTEKEYKQLYEEQKRGQEKKIIKKGKKKKRLIVVVVIITFLFLILILQNQTLSSKFNKLTCQTHFNELTEIIGKKMVGMDKNFGISDNPKDYLRVTFYGKWYNNKNHDIIIYFNENNQINRAIFRDINTNKDVKVLNCR